MNILPTKSWHVRRPHNKERVRRDEENARLEEKKEQDRIALAEKEARITYLRKKNIVGSGNDGDGEQGALVEGEHLNLFSTEEEAGVSCCLKDNEEYVQEKKDEKEKLEKSVGLLKYVGQSAVDAKNEGLLWYMEPKKRKNVDDDDDDDSVVDESKKSRLDP